MAQVDSESLPSVHGVAGDRKTACATLAGEQEPVDPDVPAESFWLSKDAEFDWFDRNAFLQRNESIKANSNSMNLNPNANPSHSKTSSIQFSSFLKSKGAIISLPKAQKTSFVDSKRRNCKLANILLFPKRSDSIGKAPAVASMAEPSSPKVSCLGRVRSKRCRSRRKSKEPATEPEKPATRLEITGSVQKTRFMHRIQSFLRSDCYSSRSNKSSVRINQSSENSSPKRNDVGLNRYTVEPEAPAGPAGLGEVARFSSGRRSESWNAVEMLT